MQKCDLFCSLCPLQPDNPAHSRLHRCEAAEINEALFASHAPDLTSVRAAVQKRCLLRMLALSRNVRIIDCLV